jgi:cysteine/O-acetylserine efflux protein
MHGYKNTLKYQAGLAIGVFLLMLLSGWLSERLLSAFPTVEPILRYVGAAYILYLAFGILKATYTFTEADVKPLGLAHGLALQILNPKLIVYAFTLFSAFLAPLARNVVSLLWIVILLAAISFCATSVWALFGTAISTHLRDRRLNIVINVILSLSLVYAAVSLTGIL